MQVLLFLSAAFATDSHAVHCSTTTRATPFPCCQRFCRSRSSVIVVAVAVLAVHLFRKPEIGNEAVQEQQTQCSADEHERLNVEMPMCRHWCHACAAMPHKVH